MLKYFSLFLKDAAARFNRIAHSVRGSIKPTDLHADAWIVASEIGQKRGSEIDFSSPADQELVLNRIYWNAKSQRDWRLESADSIDYNPDGKTPWADKLAAPLSATPLEILINREDALRSDSAIAASYTQAAAYNVALSNFNNDPSKLCAHLLITGVTLSGRIDRALEVVRRQNSLFDGRQAIAGDFIPLGGQHRALAVVYHFTVEQAELQF